MFYESLQTVRKIEDSLKGQVKVFEQTLPFLGGAIRDAFAAAGVTVKDTPQGAEWELGPDFDASKLEEIL